MDYQEVFMRFLTDQGLLPAQITRFFYSHPDIKPDIHLVANILYYRDDLATVDKSIPQDLIEILSTKPFSADVALSTWLQNTSKILEILKTKEIFDGIHIPEEQIKWAITAFIQSCPFISAKTKENYISEIEKRHSNASNVQRRHFNHQQINRNAFKFYMESQHFKPTTITLYLSAINQISEKYYDNLWKIQNPESFQAAKHSIFNHPGFPTKKTQAQRYNFYTAALNQYEAFLINKKDMPELNIKDNSSDVHLVTRKGIINDPDANLVAFCFSYGHEPLFPELNQTEAFKQAADTLKTNQTTLQNMRNYFDYYIEDNGRKGWPYPSNPLHDPRKNILETYLAYNSETEKYYKDDDKKLAEAYEKARTILKLK